MPRARVVVHTVLAVGEGKAECVLLEHIKALYVGRGAGFTVKVLGGYGKGGKGVLDYAIARSGGADYDVRFALLDTDASWDDTQRARARAQGIRVVESSPCLEAWLLEIHRFAGERDSAGHKREFERRFGGQAHDRKTTARHFGLNTLNGARARVQPLDQLLALLQP